MSYKEIQDYLNQLLSEIFREYYYTIVEECDGDVRISVLKGTSVKASVIVQDEKDKNYYNKVLESILIGFVVPRILSSTRD